MRLLKQSVPITLVVGGVMLLAACGGTARNTGGAYSPPTTSSSPATTSSALIRTAQVAVSGYSQPALTNAQGRTLYYLTSDTPTSTTCVGKCPSIWPPVMATGASTSSPSLPQRLSVFAGASGQQVEYDGHLLYTFAKDTAAGQATGEGIHAFGGTWHVATPSL